MKTINVYIVYKGHFKKISFNISIHIYFLLTKLTSLDALWKQNIMPQPSEHI